MQTFAIAEDGLSEGFRILARIMRGGTLVPYLFIIVIDYIMRVALAGEECGFTIQPRRSQSRPVTDAKKITDSGRRGPRVPQESGTGGIYTHINNTS